MHRGGRGDRLREGTYLAIVDGNQKKKIFFPIVSVGHQFFSKNSSTPENKKKKKKLASGAARGPEDENPVFYFSGEL